MMRWLAVLLMALLTLPVLAQSDDAPFDPEADLTESLVVGALTVNYPAGMRLVEGTGEIILVFAGDNTITISSEEAFIARSMTTTSVEALSEDIFGLLALAYEDPRASADVLEAVTFAGMPAIYATIENNNTQSQIFMYVFEFNEVVFSAILGTTEETFPLDVQLALMERIVANILVDGEPLPVTEATPEATLEPVIRTAPPAEDIEAVELTQTISLYEDTLSAMLPDGFMVDEAQGLLTTSEAAMEQANLDMPDLADGDFIIQLISPQQVFDVPLDEFTTLALAEYFLGNYPQAVIETYDGFGTNAYYLELVADFVPKGTFVIITQIGDNPEDILPVLGIATDFVAQEATILAIINSVVYTPAPTDE